MFLLLKNNLFTSAFPPTSIFNALPYSVSTSLLPSLPGFLRFSCHVIMQGGRGDGGALEKECLFLTVGKKSSSNNFIFRLLELVSLYGVYVGGGRGVSFTLIKKKGHQRNAR
jgi:hypothetical protein